jgi:RNA polymerase sigma-70 factor (ECF subfamily)
VAVASGDEFASAHDREQIRAALESLSPDQRVVVALRFYLDLTIEQIAERLDIPVGTVASRLHYGLKRLEAVIR